MNKLFTLLFIALLLSSCSIIKKNTEQNSSVQNKTISEIAKEADLDYQNKKRDKARIEQVKKEAFLKGKEEGVKDGYTAGLEEGEKRANIHLIKKAIKDSLSKKVFFNEEYLSIIKRAAKLEGKKEVKDDYEALLAAEKNKAFDLGYEAGVKANLKNSLLEKELTHSTFNAEKFKLRINYLNFYNKIKKFNGDFSHDEPIFNELAGVLFEEVIQYIAVSLNSTNTDKKHLLEEYNKISRKVIGSSFENYKQLYKQVGLSDSIEIKYLTNYHNAEIFAQSISPLVCTVAQIAIAFAYLDPMPGILIGMVANGLCFLLPKGIALFEDHFKKYTLYNEFNLIKGKILSSADTLISEFAVIERTEELEWSDEVRTTEGIQYKIIENLLNNVFGTSIKFANYINAQIIFNIKYGFNLKDLDIVINPDEEEFTIILPDKLEILSIQKSFHIKTIESGWFSPDLDEDFFNEFFTGVNNYIELRAKTIVEKDIGKIKLKGKLQAILILRELFKPLLLIPNMRNNFFIKFEDKKEKLYKIKT